MRPFRNKKHRRGRNHAGRSGDGAAIALPDTQIPRTAKTEVADRKNSATAENGTAGRRRLLVRKGRTFGATSEAVLRRGEKPDGEDSGARGAGRDAHSPKPGRKPRLPPRERGHPPPADARRGRVRFAILAQHVPRRRVENHRGSPRGAGSSQQGASSDRQDAKVLPRAGVVWHRRLRAQPAADRDRHERECRNRCADEGDREPHATAGVDEDQAPHPQELVSGVSRQHAQDQGLGARSSPRRDRKGETEAKTARPDRARGPGPRFYERVEGGHGTVFEKHGLPPEKRKDHLPAAPVRRKRSGVENANAGRKRREEAFRVRRAVAGFDGEGARGARCAGTGAAGQQGYLPHDGEGPPSLPRGEALFVLRPGVGRPLQRGRPGVSGSAGEVRHNRRATTKTDGAGGIQKVAGELRRNGGEGKNAACRSESGEDRPRQATAGASRRPHRRPHFHRSGRSGLFFLRGGVVSSILFFNHNYYTRGRATSKACVRNHLRPLPGEAPGGENRRARTILRQSERKQWGRKRKYRCHPGRPRQAGIRRGRGNQPPE
mmetsp:Transcript_19495/g.48903  ORF Transcript_19495/g.48903 Transcript_19495/m.48903 type:complete len:548 (+) Transcript_19495:365-2008(+)